jgi:hypothetical protein
MNFKNILWNSFLLIIIEAIAATILFSLYKFLFIGSGYIDLFDKVKYLLVGLVGRFFYGFDLKNILELIPKILIQYFLVKKYHSNLQMYQLWLYLFLYGIVMSIFWWSLSHYQFKFGIYTLTAIFNLFAIVISPFVLKKLGWDILDKLNQSKLEEKIK